MADTLANLAAAPAEIKVGGNTYRMSPLTIADRAEYERWAQHRLATLARDYVRTPSELASALEFALSIAFDSVHCYRLMDSLEGSRRLIWQSIRRNHPTVQPEAFYAELSEDQRRAAIETYNELNRAPANPPAPAGP
jgi:hypothetical protein